MLVNPIFPSLPTQYWKSFPLTERDASLSILYLRSALRKLAGLRLLACEGQEHY